MKCQYDLAPSCVAEHYVRAGSTCSAAARLSAARRAARGTFQKVDAVSIAINAQLMGRRSFGARENG
jgi:hypothetical protein